MLLNNLLVLLSVGLFILSYYVHSYVPFIMARFVVGIMCKWNSFQLWIEFFFDLFMAF